MNREQFVLDSSFLVALQDSKDVHHPRAVRIWQTLLAQEGEIFLSDVLLNEVLSVLARRCEQRGEGRLFRKVVRRFTKGIDGLPIICLYDFFRKHFPQILKIMGRYRGCFNFHDALFLFFFRQIPKVHFVTFDGDFSKVEGMKILG